MISTAMPFFGLLLWFANSHGAGTDKALSAQNRVEAFVKKAVDYINSHGKDTAFKEFNKPNGAFVNGTDYIFVIDYKGVTLANGGDPSLVGINNYDKQDVKGTYIFRDIIAKGKQGSGWTSYYWGDPVTNKLECKSSYIVNFKGEFIVGSGYYHDPNAKGECVVPQ
jgi:signal transduction histidine kinase